MSPDPGLRIVRLDLGFQGTRYEGWQSQRNNRTVQELFEKHLAKILSEKVDIHGSSRTDSGVHARGYVAHFLTRSKLPDNKIKDALNHYLTADVVVFGAKTVKPSFHARFSAKSKIYQYDIWNSPTRPLWEAPFTLWYSGPLDVMEMKKAASHFLGKHDFRALKDAGDAKENTVRTIKKISVMKKGDLIRLTVQGDGFLTHMVRIIAGTLIEVGRGRMHADQIPKIIASKTRSKAGPTAKALGLTLVKVIY